MKASIEWMDDVAFTGRTETGHSLVMDGPADNGGRNLGPRPMELLLLGLGGCTSYDVISILKKSRQAVTDCRAELDAERATEIPAVFTRIHIHFVVTGNHMKESLVKRAIDLSAEKYCSASLMLERGGVGITHDYELVQAQD